MGILDNLAEFLKSYNKEPEGALSGPPVSAVPPVPQAPLASAGIRADLHRESSALQGTEMNALDKALSIAEGKGKGEGKGIYEDILVPMAYHESAHTMDPLIKQGGGGPGRGLLQFEGERAKVAVQRAKNLFKKMGEDAPGWLDKVGKNGDVTVLSAEEQMALATYDLLEHPKADIGKVTRGKQDIVEFWADYWWAGKEKDRDKRVESFKGSLKKLRSKR